jgi:ribosomal protein S18 acetylase RimI-like enzyme
MSAMNAQPLPPGSAPSSAPRVRRGVPDDAAGVAVAHVASWRVGYAGLLPDDLASLSVEERTTSWTGHLAEGSGSRTFIALSDDDTVLGFSTVGRSRDDDATPETGELWALYTHPAAWRQGVGSALFDAAKHELQALGFQRATLWVLASNERARRFYESHGWQAQDRHKVDWRGDVRLDEVQYELPDLNDGPSSPT